MSSIFHGTSQIEKKAMDNKLIAVILLAIGSIIVGQHSIVLLGGIYILFWAYRYWPNNKAKAVAKEDESPPEEEPMEMNAERQ